MSEVTILSGVQVIYDESPKIKVKATGFDEDAHDITLDLGSAGASLRGGKDYLLQKDDDGFILKLLTNRRFVWNQFHLFFPSQRHITSDLI